MVQCAVLDVCLRGQILGRVNRRDHSFDGEEGGQVGSVRGDEDECEEPPDGAHDAAGDGTRGDVAALLHEGAQGEPERVEDTKLVNGRVVASSLLLLLLLLLSIASALGYCLVGLSVSGGGWNKGEKLNYLQCPGCATPEAKTAKQ